jgi:hypothetical protein
MKLNKAFPITVLLFVLLFLIPLKLFSGIPTFVSAITADDNGDGYIDEITIVFSENVDISDPNKVADGLDCLSVVGYTLNNGDYDDYDDIPSLTFVLNQGVSYDTDTTPRVTYSTGGGTHITETGGPLEVTDGEFVDPTDGAGAIITDVVTRDTDADGTIDRLEVTFSEAVEDDSVAAGDFGIDGGGSVDGIAVDGGVDDAVIWLDITWPTAGTDEKPTLSAGAGNIEDLAVPANTNPLTSKLAVDGANPVLIAVEITRMNIAGTDWWNRVNLTYSEPVSCGDLAPGSGLDASDATAGNFNPASEHGGDYSSGTLAGYGDFAAGGNIVVPGGEVGVTVEASGIVRFDLARSDDGHGSISAGDTAPSGDFTPVANSGIKDADGNGLESTTAVSPTSGTAWDLAKPAIGKAETYDANYNGRIDRVEFETSEAIQDGFRVDNYGIVGYGGNGYSTGVVGISGGAADNDPNDNRYSITFSEVGWDTDATPGYSYTGSDIYLVDLAGNRLNNAGGTAADGALPAFRSIVTDDNDENGYIDRLQLRFSENVDVNDAGDGLDCISIDGYTIQSGSYGAGDVDTITLILNEGAGYDTGIKPLTSYSTAGDSTIRDRAVTPKEMLNGETATTSDGAKPIMISAVFYDPDSNDIDVGDYITVEFTESMQLACTNVSDFDLLNAGFGDSFGAGADLDDPVPGDVYINIVLGTGPFLILPDLWSVPGPGNPSGIGIRAGGTACVEDIASNSSPQGAEVDIGGAGSNIVVTVTASDGASVFANPIMPAALMDSDITVTIETQFNANFVAVWYDVGAVPDGLSVANPDDRKAVASGTETSWTATIPHDDAEVEEGAVVRFIVDTDGALYYYDGPEATGGSVPWDFKVFYEQSQRVTIRNNVINPHNGDVTYINYYIGSGRKVTITAYDLAGNPVKVLFDGTGNTGTNLVTWNGRNRNGAAVVPGVYYMVIKIGSDRYVRKVLIVK